MYPLNSFKGIQTQILCRYYYISTPSPYLPCQLNIYDYIFSLLSFFLCSNMGDPTRDPKSELTILIILVTDALWYKWVTHMPMKYRKWHLICLSIENMTPRKDCKICIAMRNKEKVLFYNNWHCLPLSHIKINYIQNHSIYPWSFISEWISKFISL